MAQRYEVDTRITRLLLQVGLMCGRRGQFDDAQLIVGSVSAFRDDLPHPSIVMALCLLYEGKPELAQEQIERVLTLWPDHQIARAMLGLVYREIGNSEWSELMDQVIADGRDPWAVWLAQQSLGAQSFASFGKPEATFDLMRSTS